MTDEKEFILFCDESDRKGPYYSNFYGGIMVGAAHYERVTKRLEALKTKLNLKGEVKWEKISEPYAAKYIELMQTLFAEIRAGNLRIRIMFRQTGLQPNDLTADQVENEFFLLYYQFIKHGFGVAHAPPSTGRIRLRLYFDQFPDTGEKATQFRGYLMGLTQNRAVQDAGFTLDTGDIAEVRSHEHVLLQCLDVVLGSITFRLNNKHKQKIPGSKRRGKRTRAKEKVYRAILEEIRRIRPGFNIGISTGTGGRLVERWSAAYQHWSFVPRGADLKKRQTKRP